MECLLIILMGMGIISIREVILMEETLCQPINLVLPQVLITIGI